MRVISNIVSLASLLGLLGCAEETKAESMDEAHRPLETHTVYESSTLDVRWPRVLVSQDRRTLYVEGFHATVKSEKDAGVRSWVLEVFEDMNQNGLRDDGENLVHVVEQEYSRPLTNVSFGCSLLLEASAPTNLQASSRLQHGEEASVRASDQVLVKKE